MATKFNGVIKRQTRLFSVKAPVNISMTEAGIDIAVAGTKYKVSASWEMIARVMQTPTDSPSYLYGKPLEYLQHFADLKAKREESKQHV